MLESKLVSFIRKWKDGAKCHLIILAKSSRDR